MAAVGRLACLLLVLLGAGDHASPNIERLKADVYYLSSVTLEGRGLSTPCIGASK